MTDPSQGAEEERQKQAGKEDAVGTTIVGARPPGHGRGCVKKPHGIEVLVKKASVDPAFRQKLLDNRAAAAHEIELELSAVETAMLNSVPRSQIEKIIENTTVPDEQRRAFLGKMGAVMVAVLGLELSAGAQQVHTTRQPERWATLRWFGISADVPVKHPTSPPVVPVETGNEQLDAQVLDETAYSATVRVTYECPFETGEVMVFFRRVVSWPRAQIPTQPLRAMVSEGSGEVTFRASGQGGTTDRLVVRLRSTTRQCSDAATWLPGWSLGNHQPGEYVVGQCVIWRVKEYSKVWPHVTEGWGLW